MAFNLFFYHLVLLLLPYVTAQNNGKVSVGSMLTAGNTSAPWLSPNGDFAFGFYLLENDLFLLAIWYDKIPDKTIIWYANGDNLASKGSIIQLSDSQGLVLTSPQARELWRANVSSATISNGLMNDTGNFAVLDQNSNVLWESFSNPSDTLVPTQIMELRGTLSSRQSETNFSHGTYQLRLQLDGNLVLMPINISPNYTSYQPYYGTSTADATNATNVGLRVIFDKSAVLYVLKKNGEMVNITKPTNVFSTDQYYYRAILNHDGVFSISYHPKDPNANQSWIVAKTLPENICTEFTAAIGKGVCGFNSICTLNTDSRPVCKCPQGYSLLDPNDTYGGCTLNFELGCQQIGLQQGSQEDLYIMTDLPNTDWPESDFDAYSPFNVQDCKNSCLQDCLCVVSYFDGGSCWKKKLPLSSGRQDKAVTGTAFMKLMKDIDDSPISPHTPIPDQKKGQDQGTLITVISVLLGNSGLIIFFLVAVICFHFLFYNHKKLKRTSLNKTFAESNLRSFTFRELAEVTNNFLEELGRGSCAIVYKGTIEMSRVAVKKLDKLLQESDKEFKTEVNVIGQTHHKNLVRLLGYCDESQHRILVYEFMSNGTLASFLFGELKPTWKQRVQIASGIARGLFYLHEECFTQIIHCDIKPQNILIDEYYNARISDFGLAKLLLINQSRTETGIRGTKGYVAPDWFRSAPISAKVDVYSFGVVLLEIICCRKNADIEIGEEKTILTDWAYDCYRSGRLNVLVENHEETISDMKRLERFVRIAIWCLQEDPSVRPTMKKVKLMLEGIVPVTSPPSPYPSSIFN